MEPVIAPSEESRNFADSRGVAGELSSSARTGVAEMPTAGEATPVVIPAQERGGAWLAKVTATATRSAWTCGIVCAATLVGIVVWGLSRGFDESDEGFYLLAYQHRQPPTLGVTRFDVLEKALLGWISPNIITLRAMHLALVVISSLVLAIGIAYFQRDGSGGVARHVAIWLPFLLIAQLVGYAFGPPTLSYNHMVVALLISSLGTTLIYLANDAERRWLALPVVSGFLLGLCLFIKFPSSISAAVLTVLAVALVTRSRAGGTLSPSGWEGAGAVVLGYLLAVGLYFILVESPTTWWGALSSGLGNASGSGHSTGGLLSQYATDARGFIGWLVEASLIALACVVLHRQRRRLAPRARAVIWLALAAASGAWLYHVRGTAGSDQLVPLAYLVAIVGLVAIALAGSDRARHVWRSQPTRCWIAALLALAIPVCGAVGTNNDVVGQTLLFLGGWAAALVLVGEVVPLHLRALSIVAAVLILGSLSTFKFVDGYVVHPYRLLGSLGDQTQTIAVSGPLAHVAVDPQTATFYAELRGVGERFHLAGRPMVGMYDVPGVILALGGYGPGDPFIDSLSKGLACQDLVRLRPVDPVLLVVRKSSQGPPLGCLAQAGIDLSSYQRIASIYDPYQSRQLNILEVPRSGQA